MRNVYYIGFGPSNGGQHLVVQTPRPCIPRQLRLASDTDDYLLPLKSWQKWLLWVASYIPFGMMSKLSRFFDHCRLRVPPDETALLVTELSVRGRDLLSDFVHAPCNGGKGVPWQAFSAEIQMPLYLQFQDRGVWDSKDLLRLTFNRAPWGTCRGCLIVDMLDVGEIEC